MVAYTLCPNIHPWARHAQSDLTWTQRTSQVRALYCLLTKMNRLSIVAPNIIHIQHRGSLQVWGAKIAFFYVFNGREVYGSLNLMYKRMYKNHIVKYLSNTWMILIYGLDQHDIHLAKTNSNKVPVHWLLLLQFLMWLKMSWLSSFEEVSGLWR